VAQKPDPIPCGSSGTISSDSDETSESLHYGESLMAATLQDEAISSAFDHAWHGARKARCGSGCFPYVDSVTIQIHDISYSQQILATALYMKGQFTCKVRYSWTAQVTCTSTPPTTGWTLPPFGKKIDAKF